MNETRCTTIVTNAGIDGGEAVERTTEAGTTSDRRRRCALVTVIALGSAARPGRF